MNRPGLNDLAAVELAADAQTRFERAARSADGHRAWRGRKIVDGRDLFALSTIADRMTVEDLQLDGDLRAVIRLRAPTPVRDGGQVAIAPEIQIGLRYPEAAIVRALEGTEFIVVLAPQRVFHPNVAWGLQVMCAGRLPVGIPAAELVLLAYRALTLAECALDPEDPAGVMNRAAAVYWQQHADHIPLTREPFLAAESTDDD